MNENIEFWLVWCPTGLRSPSFRHSSEASAVAEAERLARLNAGQDFYVMRAVELRKVDSMVRVKLQSSDVQIPF